MSAINGASGARGGDGSGGRMLCRVGCAFGMGTAEGAAAGPDLSNAWLLVFARSSVSVPGFRMYVTV